MFEFFKKETKKNIYYYLEEFEKLEKKLIELNFTTMPGNWFVSNQIKEKINVNLIPEIEKFEKYSKEIERVKSFKLEMKIKPKIIGVKSKLKKLNRSINKNLKKIIKNKKHKINENENNEILNETLQIMKLFIDELHKLIFHIKSFQFYQLKQTIQNQILEDLRKKKIFLPDINFHEAEKIIEKYTDEKLILVLQYNSLEKPYLFITKNNFNEINRFILKTSKKNNKLSNYNFLISKFLSYFEIRNYGVSYEYNYYENIKKYELKEFLSFEKGECLINTNIFRTKENCLKYAYFLGATIANGYFMNLSDRLVNIHYNKINFNRINYNDRKTSLGIKNPMFHIDYNFNSFNSPKQYFTDIIFKPIDSLYLELLFGKIDLNICDITKIRNHFLEGFEDSIKRLRKIYEINKKNIDQFIYNKNQFKNLILRLDENYLNLFKEIEKEKFRIFIEELKN